MRNTVTDPSSPQPPPQDPAAVPQTGENTCPRCAGSGRLDDGRACPDCGGSGRVVETVGDA